MTSRSIHALLGSLSVALLAFASTSPTLAQSYPTKTVRIVIPFNVGNQPDILSRIIAQELSKKYGQPVIVENRVGAGGLIAAQQVKESAPDGHTLIVVDNGITSINPHLHAKLPYDPLKDFTPVTEIADSPFFIFANKALKANNVKELIAALKAKPGQYNYGTSGIGTLAHFCTAIFLNLVGAQLEPVHFKSGTEMTQGMISDQHYVACAGKISSQQVIDAGKGMRIVVAQKSRTPLAPEVPTLQEETGIAGFEVLARVGMMAPAGTPRAIVDQLYMDIRGLFEAQQLKDMLTKQVSFPAIEGPEKYGAVIRAEIEQFGKITKVLGIKPN